MPDGTTPRSTPSPQPADPTPLTTAALLREIEHLKDLVEAKFTSQDSRFEAMDKAVELLQAYPTEVDKSIANLQALHETKMAGIVGVFEEKFKAIATQFGERDTRTEQTSKDSKVAIDAALQAAKEAAEKQNASNTLAIAKSEAAFVKQIDQNAALFQTTTSALRDMIDDLKGSYNGMTGRSKGIGDSWGWLVGAVGMAGMLIAIFYALSKP